MTAKRLYGLAFVTVGAALLLAGPVGWFPAALLIFAGIDALNGKV